MLLKKNQSKIPIYTRDIHIMKGEGLLNIVPDFLKNTDVMKTAICRKEAYLSSVQKCLDNVGDCVILTMTIGRNPVNSMIQGAMSTMTKIPYDQLFHLFLMVTTTKGTITIQKLASIDISSRSHKTSKTETLTINNVPQNLTIDQLLEKTQQRMTTTKYFAYSGYDNNCQDFITAILQANNIYEGQAFIKQETNSMFESSTVRKVINSVTDLGSAVDNIQDLGS